jgi:hypothetical protein
MNVARLTKHTAQRLGERQSRPATQWRSNPVSGVGLPKTGIFAVAAGDFRLIRPSVRTFGSVETVLRIAKARH